MEPIFFGHADRRLFGVYHPPLTRRHREAAVLLCYPAVQEYMRTHWAFRKLAGLLAREGFHVLRFDYSGTGDSFGEPGDGSIPQWCSDIREAAGELQDLADVRRVSLVGMRFGATLAALAVGDGLAVQDLVLWEPAVYGKAHVRELRQIEKRKLGLMIPAPRIGPNELLGYSFPPALRQAMEATDLTTLPRRDADRILLFASAPRPEYEQLGARLRDRAGGPLRYEIVSEEAGERPEAVLLSTRILQAIANSLAGDEA